MDALRWKTVRSLFEEATTLPPEQRSDWIDRQTDDPDLARLVDELLRWDDLDSTPLDAPPPLPRAIVEPDPVEGIELGPYRLLDPIGRGGMGVVYRAQRVDGQFDRAVAIKLVHPMAGSDALQERFASERRIMATVEHPNIARLYDAGVSPDGRPYLVMEEVSGSPIDDYCADRRLSADARIGLFLQVCDAVGHAHRALVIHRDLKPSNVLVSEDGTAKLLDFGIARLLTPEREESRTPTLLMTPEYASPEQIRGEALTTASDVYALGVLLHELLTGRRPVEPGTDAVARAFETSEPSPLPLPSSVVRGSSAMGLDARASASLLEGDLDQILLKALAFEPGDRYESVGALADDLRRHGAGLPVTAQPPSTWYRLRKAVRRHRTAVVAAALVTLSLVGGSVAALTQARRADRERDAAVAVSDFLESLFSAPDPFTDEVRDTTRLVDFLETARSRLDDGLTAEPRTRARLLLTLGSVHRNLSRPDLAIPLLEDAVEAHQRAYPGGHEDAVTSRSLLGLSYAETGDLERGVETLQEALREELRRNGDGTATAAEIRGRIGRAYLTGRRHDEAEPWLRQAVETLRRVDPPDLDRLAGALNTLGGLYGQSNRQKEAIPLLEEAAEVWAAGIAGESESSLRSNEGITRMNLANALFAVGRIEEAEVQARRGLGLLESVHGPRELPVAKGQVRLGEIITAAESTRAGTARAAAADSLYRIGIATLRDLPPQPVGLTFDLSSYAKALRSWGRLEEAERAFAEALDDASRTLGPGHPLVLAITSDRGRVLSELGRTSEALQATEGALVAIGRAVPTHSPFRFNAVLNHGRALIDAGRPVEALELLRPAGVEARDALPTGHPVAEAFDDVVARAEGAARGR